MDKPSLTPSLLLPLLAWILACIPAAPAGAIEPGEVRAYDDVFAIGARAESRDRVTVTWRIAEDYYLYNNRFLAFRSLTPDVELGTPELPAGKREYDELLGEEVIKYHDRLQITVPLLSVPPGLDRVELSIRSQGCLEGVLCYPPSTQTVAVPLPPGLPESAPGPPGASATGAARDLLSGLPRSMTGKPRALTPDEAFRFEAIADGPDAILARFTAQPGYYLYVDKFRFRVLTPETVSVAGVDLPTGTIKDDPEFGRVPVLYGQAEIPIRVRRAAGPPVELTLRAEFQGCRDGDICYPPQSEELRLTLPAAALGAEPGVDPGAAPSAVRNAAGAPLSEQSRLARMLLENPAGALLAFFGAGLLLAFTPCVFPMVPILSGIIAGEGDRITTGRAFWLSLVYVLAMALTYTVAGVLAGLFGQNLQAMFQSPWIIGAFVAIFVALALSMFGFYELQLPSRWQTSLTRQSNRLEGGKLGGVALMGLLSALIVGPCVAPPLAAALIVIGSSGSPALGGSALFSMSMGMGVPLILFGVSAGRFLPRAGVWMDAVKAVFGVGLLALAIWMLERVLPATPIMVLWGLLAISSGVYLGALERLPEGSTGWRRLWKSLGVVLVLAGALELVGAASGGDNWLRPLAHLQTAARDTTSREHVAFERIKSLADLEAAVGRISRNGQPAMLDFYADWCVECIRMERNTFPDPRVQALLASVRPLQADVTDNDAVDRALMAEYGIIGPPAILFFDRSGSELPDYRLVGYFDAEEFAAHLERVMATP